MVAAGLSVDLVFRALGLVPSGRHARVVEASLTLDYTTVLTIGDDDFPGQGRSRIGHVRVNERIPCPSTI
jgi:hypothetical protein